MFSRKPVSELSERGLVSSASAMGGSISLSMVRQNRAEAERLFLEIREAWDRKRAAIKAEKEAEFVPVKDPVVVREEVREVDGRTYVVKVIAPRSYDRADAYYKERCEVKQQREGDQRGRRTAQCPSQ